MIWGDKGEEKTVLEPFDLIAMPPQVTRTFKNIYGRSAAEFTQFLRTEHARYAEMVRVANVPKAAQ